MEDLRVPLVVRVPQIGKPWPKGFGKLVWCILMWIAGSAFFWYDALIIIISSNYFYWTWMFDNIVKFKTLTITVPVCPLNWIFLYVFHIQTNF